MWILFAVISAVLLLAIIGQQIQYRKIKKEINYISGRLESISICSENGFLLLPTDNQCIKRLGKVLNALLQDFYTNKSGFQQAREAMARVLTNISHDIRTPLTVLKGNSEMLASGTAQSNANTEKIREIAAKIDKKADELITTINDYFTLSKIASGDFPINLKTEDLSRICRDTILDYYDILERKHFDVDIRIPDGPIFAATDRDALQRILKNLIDNALKYGAGGKYISISLTEENGNHRINIEDHGKGIPPLQQEQIFTRNYTTAPKTSGSGLGLSIAQNLAEQIGARLELYSRPDEKTVFSVILK